MASDGFIEELGNNTFGRLDVPPFTIRRTGGYRGLQAFYLVEIGGGTPLFNVDPIQMYTRFTHLPGDQAEIETLFEFGFLAFFPPVQLYEQGPLAPSLRSTCWVCPNLRAWPFSGPVWWAWPQSDAEGDGADKRLNATAR